MSIAAVLRRRPGRACPFLSSCDVTNWSPGFCHLSQPGARFNPPGHCDLCAVLSTRKVVAIARYASAFGINGCDLLPFSAQCRYLLAPRPSGPRGSASSRLWKAEGRARRNTEPATVENLAALVRRPHRRFATARSPACKGPASYCTEATREQLSTVALTGGRQARPFQGPLISNLATQGR